MSKNYFSEIIKQFTKNRYSQKTENKIQEWIINEKHFTEKDKEIHNFWESLDMYADKSTYNSLNTINKKLKIVPKKNFFKTYLPRIAAVIIPIAVLIGLTIYFLPSNNNIITVYVPYGEQRQILLPDNSVVWINSGSTLKYSKEFKNKDNSRTVNLYGEAYFSVTKDTLKHFIVKTDKLNVEVLGTEFNVNAYPEDDLITTAVKKGKVQVEIEGIDNKILYANEKIIYNKLTSEYITSSIEENVFSWKDGELFFKKKTIIEILKVLERRYNVEFDVKDKLLSDQKIYTINFTNGENLTQILEVLSEMIGFSFEINDRHIKLNYKD